jgi:16S rRNA U516 pseudouridylate synthase RsuA-like enzyme
MIQNMAQRIRKRRVGRPRVPHPRRRVLSLKVTAGERQAIRRMAAAAGCTVSTFILRKVLGGE